MFKSRELQPPGIDGCDIFNMGLYGAIVSTSEWELPMRCLKSGT